MSAIRLILASLVYHRRVHVAVALGAAAATAVLTGALLVGDSMRGSLRDLTLERLGRIEYALVTDRFFQATLADRWAGEAERAGLPLEAVPVILVRASLEKADSDPPARANQVSLIGLKKGSDLFSAGPKADQSVLARTPRKTDLTPFPEPRQIVLNEPLAEQLGAKAGDSVIVRLHQPGTIPAENPMGRRAETILSQRVVVSQVIPARGLGRFSLQPNQQLPRNAYVPLEWLQERLGKPGRANALLATKKGSDLFSTKPDADRSVLAIPSRKIDLTPFPLSPSLADYGIHLDRPDQGYWRITTDRLIFEPAVEQAVERALRTKKGSDLFSAKARSDRRPASWKIDLTPFPAVQPVLTYLANTIACRDREIPYSLIAAIDFADRPPLGPMLSAEGEPLAPLADGQIALNAWAADDLGAKVGDTIRVSFFEPESTHGQVRQKTEAMELAAIVRLSGAAADPALTPDVPGVTDRLTLAGWAPPFPFDARRVRKKDEDYWEARRGTPKAFVSLATGRRLWGSRFGQTTCLRIAPAEGQSIEQLREQLRPDPAALGFVVQPVRSQGLAASTGTTPFEFLFLGFSMFLIASAVMLVAILFRLGVDRRANEIGILLAAGFRRRHVVLLLAGEGLVVIAAGSLLGLGAGVGYAALMLAGLESWWLAAVSTPFLSLHVTARSLLIGYFSGVIVALGAIVASARRAARTPPRQLLAGRTTEQVPALAGRSRRAAVLAWGMLAAAVVVGLAAGALGQEARAGAFFGAGALVLAAALAWIRTRLAAGATGPAVALGGGNLLRLAVRSAARNPGRSTLTIGLVAAASFVIAAVSAFRVDVRGELLRRDGGSGGFALMAQSDQPIYHDLNTPEGRRELAFSDEDARRLAGSQVFPLRVRPGDDASCLNLYQPQQPRILGVPNAVIDRGGFAWAGFLRVAGADPRLPPDARDAASNPWRLLELRLGTDEDGLERVPVILEKNTANYSLHLWKGVGQTYDVPDGRGGTVRLQIVGLLSGSIFQGDLLVSESALLERFAHEGGYREFLVETPPDRADDVQAALERTLSDFGLAVETTAKRLAAFQAVQNTYLSTFQSLGGLGLLLGTFGLAAVQLRSVLERRSELALLRAVGFRRRVLAGLVLMENALLLIAGLACGVLAALVAVVPHLVTGGATIPWAWLGGMLAMVLVAGLLAGLWAVRAALATPLLAALRGE